MIFFQQEDSILISRSRPLVVQDDIQVNTVRQHCRTLLLSLSSLSVCFLSISLFSQLYLQRVYLIFFALAAVLAELDTPFARKNFRAWQKWWFKAPFYVLYVSSFRACKLNGGGSLYVRASHSLSFFFKYCIFEWNGGFYFTNSADITNHLLYAPLLCSSEFVIVLLSNFEWLGLGLGLGLGLKFDLNLDLDLDKADSTV